MVEVNHRWLTFNDTKNLRRKILLRCLNENKTIEELLEENDFSSHATRSQCRKMFSEMKIDQEVFNKDDNRVAICPYCGQPTCRKNLAKKYYVNVELIDAYFKNKKRTVFLKCKKLLLFLKRIPLKIKTPHFLHNVNNTQTYYVVLCL